MRRITSFFQRSIQAKIALWSGLCLIATILVVVLFASVELRRIAVAEATAQASSVAQVSAIEVHAELESALSSARTLAATLAASRAEGVALSRDEVNRLLRGVIAAHPHYLGVFTLWEPEAFDAQDARYVGTPGHDETGRFIPYWSRGSDGILMLEPLLDYTVAGAGDYYLCPKTSGRECIIDPYIYPVQGEDILITSLVAPIFIEGRFVGIAGIDLGLSFLQTLADQVELYDGQGKLALISHGGALAAVTGQPELIGQSAVILHPEADDSAKIWRALAGERVLSFLQGDDSLEVFEPISFGQTATPWVVNMMVPSAVVTVEAQRMSVLMAGLGFAVALLGLGMLWLVAGRLVRPIRAVTTAAQAVAAGQLDVNAEVNTRDETGALAESFNQMTAGLRRTLASERKANEAMRLAMETQVSKDRLEATVGAYLNFVEQVANGDLRARLELDEQSDPTLLQLGRHLNAMVLRLGGMAAQVHQAAEAIAATATEILAATSQQAAAAAEQSAAVTQTTTTIDEVRAIALQTAQQAGQVARDSATMLAATQQGTCSVEATMASMDQIHARVQSIAQTILALAEQTQAIGAITATVSEIADQSNLLALNAAIEAARAGEQGKSFAVVAQHVRALAERSKEATVKVREILGEIQRTTNAAVLVTEEGAKGAEIGSQRAAQTGEVIHRIANEVEGGSQATTQIAAAAQQQTLGVDQIGQAMGAIQQATSQTLASTRQAERAAQDLHSLAQSLQQAIGVYKLA